jgi:hypothetical protein
VGCGSGDSPCDGDLNTVPVSGGETVRCTMRTGDQGHTLSRMLVSMYMSTLPDCAAVEERSLCPQMWADIA